MLQKSRGPCRRVGETHQSVNGGFHPPYMIPRVGTQFACANRFRPPSLKIDSLQLSILSAEINASCGISTFPNWRIFFLPAFCFSSSFFFRVASPP